MNESRPNGDDPLDALFALARTHPPETSRAEYAFETRLLARLKTQRESGSVWAMVSWRMIPLFAIGVVALTIWQTQTIVEATEAEQVACVENPDALDAWANLDL